MERAYWADRDSALDDSGISLRTARLTHGVAAGARGARKRRTRRRLKAGAFAAMARAATSPKPTTSVHARVWQNQQLIVWPLNCRWRTHVFGARAGCGISWSGAAPASSLVDGDSRVAEQHHLTRADLARFTRFDAAVDGHRAVGDHQFGLAAAVRESRNLQQIVEFDVVASEREIEVGHGRCTFRRGVRIISHKLALKKARCVCQCVCPRHCGCRLRVGERIASKCKQMLCACQKVKRRVTPVATKRLHS